MFGPDELSELEFELGEAVDVAEAIEDVALALVAGQNLVTFWPL
jgi:hypothetical protein